MIYTVYWLVGCCVGAMLANHTQTHTRRALVITPLLTGD